MSTSPAQAIEIDEAESPDRAEAPGESPVRDLIESLPERLAETNPVEIRLSLPLGFDRYFVSLTAGPERRRPDRRLRDRIYYPLFTLGNALFMGMTTIIGVVSAVLGLIAFSSIVTF